MSDAETTKRSIRILYILMVFLICISVYTMYISFNNSWELKTLKHEQNELILNTVEELIFQTKLEEGLIAYWSFDEDTIEDNTIKDTIGANDATNYGAIYIEEGMDGGAYEFNGSNYINCGSDESLVITDDITIAMWIKFNKFTSDESITNNNLYRFYHRGDWAGDNIYFLYKVNVPEDVDDKSPCDSSWDSWAGVKTIIELQEGEWYHVVGVKSGDTISIYINGIRENSQSECFSDGFTVDNSKVTNLFLGRKNFNGAIDELKIWNKALPLTEIKFLAITKEE